MFNSVHDSFHWSHGILNLFNLDCASQNEGVTLLLSAEHYTRRIKQDNVLIELHLLHSFGHTRSISCWSCPRSLQRIDQTALAYVWESNNTHVYGLLSFWVTLNTRIILQQVHKILRSNGSRCGNHFVNHLGLVNHALFEETGSLSEIVLFLLIGFE